MTIEKRPTSVIIIGWIWILGGALLWLSVEELALKLLMGLEIPRGAHTLVVVGRGGIGIVGFIAGIMFLKCKTWAHKVLKLLVVTFLATAVGSAIRGLFHLSNFRSITGDTMGWTVILVILTVIAQSIPLILMLWYLRSPVVADAMGE